MGRHNSAGEAYFTTALDYSNLLFSAIAKPPDPEATPRTSAKDEIRSFGSVRQLT